MTDVSPNLDKLRQLCDELTDRDKQLKVNASTLWDILEIIKQAKTRLINLSVTGSDAEKEKEELVKILDGIGCIIATKGCKRVVSDE